VNDRVPAVSIIIPTRNGSDTLPLTLRGIASQTYPRGMFELIVVDDGSSDGTLDRVTELRGLTVSRLRQEASGAAAARNRGASHARGTLLVFLDDDIELSPGAIEALTDAHGRFPRAIVTGWLNEAPPSNPFERLQVIRPASAQPEAVAPIEFTQCYTGLLSVHADDFAACGGFEDPTGGTPSWDDIDFGYRARRAGFELLRCAPAHAVHHDRTSSDLHSLCRRWHDASVSAVRLFQRHPGIENAFDMYRDKLPVRWRRDPWPLVAQKLLRSAASCRPAHWCVRGAADALATRCHFPAIARTLCGLAISGSIWRGLREGIARYGAFTPLEERRG
jgi:glycosyltransferase involved in cell wall biosynthesis